MKSLYGLTIITCILFNCQGEEERVSDVESELCAFVTKYDESYSAQVFSVPQNFCRLNTTVDEGHEAIIAELHTRLSVFHKARPACHSNIKATEEELDSIEEIVPQLDYPETQRAFILEDISPLMNPIINDIYTNFDEDWLRSGSMLDVENFTAVNLALALESGNREDQACAEALLREYPDARLVIDIMEYDGSGNLPGNRPVFPAITCEYGEGIPEEYSCQGLERF